MRKCYHTLFNLGAGDPNSGLHDYAAGTFPSEASSWPIFQCYFDLYLILVPISFPFRISIIDAGLSSSSMSQLKKKFKKFCVYGCVVSACVSVHCVCAWCVWKPEEGI